jgi:hypothetical protein
MVESLLPRNAAIANGRFSSVSVLHKYGRNFDIDIATSPEDIWDGGGIWVAPTQARVHSLASTNAADAAGGTGARTVVVEGLTSWEDQVPYTETVTMNGTDPVNTTTPYVIIYRMYVRTAGSGAANAGDITATAAVDGTVTAKITAGYSQTLMAIYGAPRSKNLMLTRWYASINRAVGQTLASGDLLLLTNYYPDEDIDLFRTTQTMSVVSSGNSYAEQSYDTPIQIPGPCILCVQCELAGKDNMDISSGFDAYVVDK